MNSEKISKYLFITMSIVTVSCILFGLGMYSAYNRTPLFWRIKHKIDTFQKDLESTKETSFFRPEHLVQPARYEGNGVTINKVPETGELMLISGFFGEDNEIRLMKRDGTLVNRWILLHDEIFEDTSFLANPPATKWNVDTHGVLAMPDGSVVFNFEYNGMARLDRCGKVMWTVNKATHHSLERSEKGGFWVPSRNVYKTGDNVNFPPFEVPLVENILMRVADNGEILEEISVPQLFYDNGLDYLLTSSAIYYTSFVKQKKGGAPREITHLNKITELSAAMANDFPMFAVGDLLLSLRDLNMLMVVDPVSKKIKWWRIGPWVRQHDSEYRPGGTIAVFNNNMHFRVAYKGKDRYTQYTRLTVPRVSNIMEVHPATGEHNIIYGMRPGQEMLSVFRSKVEFTEANGLLVTEFDGGRVFETDAQGNIIWQYINRYDDDEVSETTGARLYQAGYFNVDDWSCDNR